MAATNNYSYKDPNAGDVVRTASGDRYTIFAYGVCYSGVAIKIFDGTTEILFSCYKEGSLVVAPIAISDSACDCINGGCLPAAMYSTPGKFSNLANCQSACAKDSTCTGECVSPEQIAALQQAASNVRSRLCK